MVINLNTFGLPLFIGKSVLPEIITKLKKTSQAQSYPLEELKLLCKARAVISYFGSGSAAPEPKLILEKN